MAQQLNVNVAFTADTAKARAQIQDLQSALSKLMNNPSTGTYGNNNMMSKFQQDTQKARLEVAQLQSALQSATNATTGKLNLNDFNRSLKESGLTIDQLQNSLVSLGPQGEQAFVQLARSIMTAEAPLKKTNGLIDKMWDGLKRTAGWQLYGSVLRGLQGAFQQAFGYAQDLNESLNKIQIVTQNSSAEMARFAQEAGRAAKELSTTTTAYTDASLIYYQQGLSTDEVKARADITIKAANAAGTSAAEMADYLTAVWNSYKVGTDDLERYVDIMAALGAGTATSLEEISTSMEKVASVGEAVGVRFEQMGSIIATVTSVTRQSAESVGTAFKTIFARMADLKLEGSIEEDGVTTSLGTVSKQLKQIGIDILDANGDLRDMGSVLEELMGKWNTMNGATQQAVAIALAGKRQYTDLLALMNNQDLYNKSIGIAEDADGTLQKQADIYAHSWEASSKRVRAAAEGIYDSLINDDFFINMNDGIATFLSGIEAMIDGLGGFKGALLAIGAIVMQVFNKQITAGAQRAVQAIASLTPAGRRAVQQQKEDMAARASAVVVDSANTGGEGGNAKAAAMEAINKAQTKLLENAERLNEADKKAIGYLLDQQAAIAKNVEKRGEELQKAKEIAAVAQRNVMSGVMDAKDSTKNFGQRYSTRSSEAAMGTNLRKNLATMMPTENSNTKQAENSVKSMLTYLDSLKKVLKNMDLDFNKAFGNSVAKTIDNTDKKAEGLIQKLKQFGKDGKTNIKSIEDAFKAVETAIKKNVQEVEKLDAELLDTEGHVQKDIQGYIQSEQPPGQQLDATELAARAEEGANNFRSAVQQVNNGTVELVDDLVQLDLHTEGTIGGIDRLALKIPSMTQVFTGLGGTILTLGTAINSVISLFSTLSNPDLSGMEKFSAVLTTIGITLMSVIPLISSLNQQNLAAGATAIASALGIKTFATAEEAQAYASKLAAKGTKEFMIALWELLLPIMPIVIAITALIAVVAAVAIGISKYNQSILDNANAMNEAMEKTRKLNEETESLNGEVEDLTKTLKEQRDAGEDISDTYKSLVDKLEDVRNNYRDLGVDDTTLDMIEQAEAVGLATDNWGAYADAIAKAGDEAERAMQKQAAATVQADLEAASTAFRKGDGKKSGNNLVRHVGAAGTNKEVADILSKYEDIMKKVSGDDGTLTLSMKTPAEFLRDYERLDELIGDIERAGATNVDTYRELKVEFDAMADYAQAIRDNMDDASVYKITEAMDSLGIDPSKIETLDDYTYTLQEVIKKTRGYFGSAEEAEKYTTKFLKSFANTGPAAEAISFLDRFNNKLQTSIKIAEESVKDTTYISAPGQEITPTYHTEYSLAPKFSKEQIKEEYQKMYEYIKSLSEQDQALAFNINLNYIDSVEEFKGVLEKTKDFEAKIKIKADPESVLATAKSIRDDLSDVMEDFSKQGYLTTTQATEFIDEFPQYAKYLTKTAQGYALTTTAVKEFNDALEDEKKALEEITNPTNVGGKALYDFGLNLISLEAAVDNQKLKDMIVDMQDLTAQFIEGEISQQDYFNSLIENIQNIDFSELSETDILAVTNDVIPELTNGVTTFMNAMTEAFDAGKIGATEYRDALRQTANATLSLVEKGKEAILSSKTLSKSIKQLDDGTFKSLNKEAENTVNSLNDLVSTTKDLHSALDDMNDFEPIMQAATADYNDLQDIFAEDFSIEIDSSQLDEAITKTQDYRDSIAEAFSTLSDEAQANVVDKIYEIGNAMYGTEEGAYAMQTASSEAFWNMSAYAGTATNDVTKAAVDMLNGTYTATTENADLTAKAMGLILESGASTTQLLSNQISSAIDHLGQLVQNFDAEITFEPGGIGTKEVGRIPILDIPIVVPTFKISVKGKLQGKAADAFSGLMNDFKMINAITNSSSAGTMSSYKPKEYDGTAASPSSPKLDSAPSGSGSKGGKGGSGGKGSSGKEKDPQSTDAQQTKLQESTLDRLEDVVERYRDTNEELEKMERKLNKISRTKDEAYGQHYLDAIDAEIEALKEENEILERQQKEALKYREEDIEKLRGLGFDVQIGDDGNIVNFEDLQKQITNQKNAFTQAYDAQVNAINGAWDADVNAANASYDAYVNGLGDDAKDEQKSSHDAYLKAIEADKDAALEAAQKVYDEQMQDMKDAMGWLDTIDEATQVYYDNQEKMEENLAKIREENYEKIINKLETRLQLSQNEIRQIEFMQRRMEGDFNKSPAMVQSQMDLIGRNIMQLHDYDEAMQSLELAYRRGEISEQAYADGLQEIQDGTYDVMEAILDLEDEIKGAFISALDEADDKLSQIVDQFDHLVNVTNSYENILKLLGKSTDYKKLGQLYEARENVLKDSWDSKNDIYKRDLDLLADAQQQLDIARANGNEKAIRYYEDLVAELQTRTNQAQEDMLSAAEAYAEAIQQTYDNALKAASQTLEKAITGSSYDEVMQKMDKLKKHNDNYLTSVNQQYETQKLINQANLDIDKAANQVARNKLQTFIEETKQLQSQGKLSKLELDLQKAKYEILLAEIAMQEAQNNKSQVRLQRDSEGNFNYVYTADENKIAEAQQQWEDANNNYYNIALEGANKYAEEFYSIMADGIAEIEELYQNHEIDKVERDRRIQQLYYDTLEQMGEAEEIYTIASNALGENRSDAWGYYIKEDIGNTEDFRDALDTYMDDCEDAESDWEKKTDDLSNLVAGHFEDVTDSSKALREDMQTTLEDTTAKLQEVATKTNAWAQNMSTYVDNVINRYEKLARSAREAHEIISGFTSDVNWWALMENAGSKEDLEYYAANRQWEIDNNINGKGIYADNNIEMQRGDFDQAAQISQATNIEDAIDAGIRRAWKIRTNPDVYKGYTGTTMALLEKKFREEGWTPTPAQLKKMEDEIGQFKTGGYTGEFGPEGKLAVLHEKELVLNKEDTQNMLDAVNIVRDLINSLEYERIMVGLQRDFTAATLGGMATGELEQNVHIQAEFPNVQDSSEIEKAFNTLINQASQYANRKSR